MGNICVLLCLGYVLIFVSYLSKILQYFFINCKLIKLVQKIDQSAGKHSSNKLKLKWNKNGWDLGNIEL